MHRETSAMGKASHRGHRGHGGGNGGLDGGVLPWTPGLPGDKRNGESIAQRSQRGMEVLMVVVLSVNALRFRARKKPTLSFTGVLPIEFLWALTQIPPP
jgi:hypothetical protein